MQKLSRTERYKDYRNKLNNDGEREIATKELKELQEKIIFNEKRFGNTSRTEFDLNRGNKGVSYENLTDDYQSSTKNNQTTYTNDLDDIFSELNKYKKTSLEAERKTTEESDDYIKKIKDIVNNSNVRLANSDNHEELKRYQDKSSNTEEFKEPQNLNNDFLEKDKTDIFDQAIESINEVEDDASAHDDSFISNKQTLSFDEQQVDEAINNIAEFEETNIQENAPVKSQLENIQITKPVIEPIVPQHDHSKEFEEICENVNSLAEEIESSSSFGEDLFTSSVSNHIPMNSFESIQQNIKKDIINSNNNFLDALQEEIDQHTNKEEGSKDFEEKTIINNTRKPILKNNEDNKEEFDNTVSIQVGKLLGEINSSKADNISAADVIANNNIAKKNINNNPGKTIAFEANNNKDIPDNTIVITHPTIEDSSIHTMSFKTEELDIDSEEKSNTLLNIILSVLIIVAIVALLVIVYFFLITRGII